ncbi:MAG: hypothetical protein JEZ14_26535 [Marinilabiliaceae bacterium]|nr:hypothetical protein [Marinilabiliaceae bacterium]
MNQIQRNQYAMFIAVKNTIATNRPAIESNVVMVTVINSFSSLLDELSEVRMIQEGHAAGSGQLKQKEEAEMIQATVQVAAAVYVYAIDQNLPDLQAKASVSPSQLQRMNAEKLKTTCLNIHALAAQLDGNLTDYGVTPEAIINLKKEIDDFAAVIASPRSAIVTRSQATTRVAELISELNQLLKTKADKLMLLFQHSHPAVYQTYKAARIIVDLHKAKKKEEVED